MESFAADSPQHAGGREPLPLADALVALDARETAAARLLAALDAFRAALRLVATLALSARLQFGPGRDERTAEVAALVRKLRARGLTEGEWVGLTRGLLAPHAAAPEEHPLPPLVTLFTARGSAVPRAFDALLGVRNRVAHRGMGDAAEQAARLVAAIEALAVVRAALEPLWNEVEFVLPLACPSDDTAPQHAWSLAGYSPPHDLFRRIALAPGEPIAPGELVVVDRSRRARLVVHPLVRLARPGPGAPHEMFFLEGSTKRAALYLALPSCAELHDDLAWDALGAALGEGGDDGAAPRGAIAPGGHDAAGTATRPYRGLASFGPEHAHLFVGRDALLRTLVNRVRARAWVTVTGTSGAGKTSLLRAGVVPALTRAESADNDDASPREGAYRAPPHSTFAGAWMRPGLDPCAALARAVAAATGSSVAIDAAPESLVATIAAWSGGTRTLLIVVDQAEEALTLCTDRDARAAFARALAALGADDAGPSRVILSVRGDFFHRLAELGPIAAQYARDVVVVTTPDRDALLLTLEAPARAFGVALEDGLAARMVDEVAQVPAALALLQFTADRLWDARDRAWRRMTVRAYEALGGVAGALARHADAVVDAMPPAHQRLARDFLLRLVTADGTRVVAPRAELVATAADGAAATAVIDALVEARLLTASGDDTDGGASTDLPATIEIAHEALLQHWTRLRVWRDEDREGHRHLAELRLAARQWDARARTPALLWRGDVLAAQRTWRARVEPALTPLEREFLRAGEAAESRARRTRAAVAAVALAVLASASAALFALWRRAEVERAVAAGARSEAETRLWSALGATASSLARDPARRRDAIAAAVRAVAPAVRAGRPVPAQARAGLVDALAPGPIPWSVGGGEVLDDVLFAPDGRVLATPRGEARSLVDPTGRRPAVAPGAPARWLLPSGAPGQLVAVSTVDAVTSANGAFVAGRDVGLAVLDEATGRVVRRGGAGSASAASDPLAGIEVGGRDARGGIEVWDARSLGRRGVLPATAGHPLAVSDDGAMVLTANAVTRGADLWRVASGDRAAEIPGGERAIVGAAFAPRVGGLVTITSLGAVTAWDARTGTAVGTVSGVSEPLDVAFAPDGLSLAVATWSGTVHTFRWPSLSPVGVLSGHAGPVWSVSYSPDGARLLTASTDRTARVWDARTGRELERVALELEGRRAEFASDGRFIRVQMEQPGASGTRLVRLHTGPATVTVRAEESRPLVGFAAGDRAVWVVGWARDGVAQIALPSGEWRRIGDPPFAAAPDGSIVAIGPEGALSDGATGAARGRVGGAVVAFSRDGRLAFAREGDGLAAWSVAPVARRARLRDARAEVAPDAVSHDGRRVVGVATDGSVRVWTVQDGEPEFTVRPAAEGGSGATRAWFALAGTRAIVLTETALEVYAIAGTPRRLASVPIARHRDDDAPAPLVIATSSDGARVFNGGTRPALAMLLDTRTGAAVATHAGGAACAEFSPEGTRLATCGERGAIDLWDAASGHSFATLPGDGTDATRVAFSPDGAALAVGGSDGVVRVWDVVTRTVLATLPGHTGTVWSVVFSHDAAALATSDDAGTVRVFPLAPAALLAEACALLAGQPEVEGVRSECAPFAARETRGR